MESELNDLEKAILLDIGKTHANSHPNLINQILNIQIASREYTGVGVYVNFVFEKNAEVENNNIIKCLATNSSYKLDGLKYPISFELNLTKEGKLEFLELASNGNELWNGTYNSFEQIENE